ncbi:hypothetical protein GOP47_0012083 [Adiantum capillus-veneris]|uniref:Histone-lysine N-methyltransferase NSD-like PHD zinc finger domain-containing protein n=1 Tax=Adiantum capillus-veneris TaxID=13818 RepID=A0A9D4UTZ3_ADICA|nr:hypothetical protein GOP47_0012083 [Adiantum capillus-veneris]
MSTIIFCYSVDLKPNKGVNYCSIYNGVNYCSPDQEPNDGDDLNVVEEMDGYGEEVYLCDAAICGHFYHLDCVVEMILKDKDTNGKAVLAKSIKEGKGFAYPMQKCCK